MAKNPLLAAFASKSIQWWFIASIKPITAVLDWCGTVQHAELRVWIATTIRLDSNLVRYRMTLSRTVFNSSKFIGSSTSRDWVCKQFIQYLNVGWKVNLSKKFYVSENAVFILDCCDNRWFDEIWKIARMQYQCKMSNYKLLSQAWFIDIEWPVNTSIGSFESNVILKYDHG